MPNSEPNLAISSNQYLKMILVKILLFNVASNVYSTKRLLWQLTKFLEDSLGAFSEVEAMLSKNYRGLISCFLYYF